MKKLWALALATALSVACIGCGNQTESKKNTRESIDVQTDSDATQADTSEPVVASDLWQDSSVAKKVDEINSLIDKYYYFDVDRDKQEEALYDGIMDGLDDPYSVYYTKEEYAELQEDTSGEYVGIGAVVTMNSDMRVEIVRPIKNSPAEQAGLKAGDILVQVDDTEITDQELNSPAFKLELQEVVDTLRESMLKSRFAMERFCYEHGGKISGGWTQNYGYIVETEHYRYCLRCNPSPGDYNCYCTAYDLDVQRQNMAQDKPLVGRVTYANGDAQEFTDAEAFLKCVREELPYRPTTGFRYEVLADDPSVRRQVDDIIFDLYGEEAPCRQEDHEPRPEQGMTFGGM